MNILMVYPEFPDTFWSFKHALRFIRKQASQPPLGLCTVAAMLPETWGIRLIDLNVRKLRGRDLSWADCVFISGMTLQRDSANEIIARCKAAGLTIVAGGPLFTIEHESFEAVDHFVLNEAEVTFPGFLEDFLDGAAEKIYTTHEFARLEESPIPRWDIVDRDRYASMCMQFSRGCPYNCEFCNVTTLFGHRPRTKRPQQIIAELDGLYRLGWRGDVFFVDDNLIGHRKALKEELLPALIEWRKDKRGLTFGTQASINLADDREMMGMMVEAGFRAVFIGIETPNEESLAECNKKHNLKRDLAADVRSIQRAGLQVQGGFIVGFDHDKPNIFQRQIDFIQNSGIVTAMVGMLQAPDGTKLFERLKQAGRLLGKMTGDNVDGSTNILPMMGLETLRKGYQEIARTIYDPEKYYQRVKTFFKEYEPPSIKIQWQFRPILTYLYAFLMSIVRLGIVGKERLQYWKLLGWTIRHKPKLFPLAVTLAIYGYHFRTVTELRVL
jgi:radical SAM superfamily enzyme YgiQ (UPF0313 family)